DIFSVLSKGDIITDGRQELKETLDKLLEGAYSTQPLRLAYPPPIEEALLALGRKLAPLLGSRVNPRWIALCLLTGEREILEDGEFLGWLKGEAKDEHAAKVLFGRDPSTSRRSAGPAR
ncbi:MAG: hypothetical protein ACUVRM_04730, partial [Bacillota bacterium]